MEAVEASKFVRAGHQLGSYSVPDFAYRQLFGNQLDTSELSKQLSGLLVTGLSHHRRFCQLLGLPMTERMGIRLAKRVTQLPVTFSELATECKAIYDLLQSELDTKLFMQVESRHVPYYNDWANGWELAIEKFPHITFDVEEASKCLALSRYTACVFHLSRIAEIGSVVVGKAVGYSDPKPSLHSVLKYLENALKVARDNYTQAHPAIKGNADFYSEVVVHMRAVNQAWRQRVSHMDSKYTEEESERVFGAIKSLMQHTATKLSESATS